MGSYSARLIECPLLENLALKFHLRELVVMRRLQPRQLPLLATSFLVDRRRRPVRVRRRPDRRAAAYPGRAHVVATMAHALRA